jgi:hypothetical protein
MKQFSLEEYKKIIDDHYNNQYGERIESYEEGDYAEIKDIKHFQEIKCRKFDFSDSIANITDVKKDQLRDYIQKYRYFTIGNFSIRINSLTDEKFSVSRFGKRASVAIYENINNKKILENYRTLHKVNPNTDDRFVNCEWIGNFHNSNGYNINTETMVEILRWLQCVSKLRVFL